MIRTLFCLHENRFFYHKHDLIATKLAHDGPQLGLHPGFAQGQGQGQRSRDTDTFLTHENRFFYHKHNSIATKLAHDGFQMGLPPGCAQGQGQGQRSRDTGTTNVMKCLLYSTVSRSVSTCAHFMKHIILSFQYKYQAARCLFGMSYSVIDCLVCVAAVHVSYYAEHRGRDNEVAHQQLTRDQRAHIAGMLS